MNRHFRGPIGDHFDVESVRKYFVLAAFVVDRNVRFRKEDQSDSKALYWWLNLRRNLHESYFSHKVWLLNYYWREWKWAPGQKTKTAPQEGKTDTLPLIPHLIIKQIFLETHAVIPFSFIHLYPRIIINEQESELKMTVWGFEVKECFLFSKHSMYYWACH